MHLHHPHLSSVGHPHLDLRALRHDARVAAEVALVAVVLGVSVDRAMSAVHDRDTTAHVTSGAAVTAPVVGAVVAADVPTLSVATDASGTTAHVHLPAGASGRIAVLDASGTVVTEVTLTGTGTDVRDLAAGSYTLVLHEEGPVEVIGDAAVSSATALRSRAFTVDTGAAVHVVIDR